MWTESLQQILQLNSEYSLPLPLPLPNGQAELQDSYNEINEPVPSDPAPGLEVLFLNNASELAMQCMLFEDIYNYTILT